MIRIRIPRPLALGLALAAAGVGPAAAQTEIVAAPNPDADRLAEQVRALATDPRDVNALLTAGLLSAKLGDTAAALAFFQRAETLDPTNPRILSGRGAALVRLERPGEALRLFQTAEARGVPIREYASDRGFAYDLLGAPQLAQRDYAVALASGDRDEETLRRYALSLGITGQVDQAMTHIDSLLRRSDRAAWRARAFVLAMNGDVAGAERIAASMMPGTMGQALAPFFRRLATLSPADRAFAVHFGELSPTQARLADARLAPALPRYVPEQRPVQVAAVAAPDRPAASQRDRRSRREREREGRAVAPVASPPPKRVEVAAAPPLPAPPQFTPPPQPIVQPLPGQSPAPAPTPSPAPVQLAGGGLRSPERGTGLVRGAADEGGLRFTPAPAPAEPPRATPAPAPAPIPRTPVAAPPAPQPEPRAAAPQPAPVVQPIRPEPEQAPIVAARAPEPPRTEPAPEQSRPVAAAPAPVRTTPVPPGPARVGQEDSILAAIVGGLTIPAEELAVVTAPPVDPVPVAAPETLPARAEPAPAPRPAPVKPEPKPKEAPKPEAPAKDAKAKADPKAKGAKPDPKTAKPDPKKDPAKAEPARVWVQVAGGANEASLPKAWAAAVAKAPTAFKGKSGWWTPLRATNRVLAGPFKTAAEAQSFVNAITKQGLSAFVFTSEAGQKITRLGAK